ncbi:hypothetical protein PM082_007015 [Marasmius tenuissimus]|nr:hypothetical protein PM082_007015 [Marasmius tenuissimus]
MSLEEDLSVYQLVMPMATLTAELSSSEVDRKHRLRQPIYLFLRRPPLNTPECTTSSSHYWSFFESGQPRLPLEACDLLGLPIELRASPSQTSFFWPTSRYKLIHQYQLYRGFDPATADFARHVYGTPILFRPLDDSDRFEAANDDGLETRENQEGDEGIGAYNYHDPDTYVEFRKTLDSTMLKLWTNYKRRYVLSEDIVVAKDTEEERPPDNGSRMSSSGSSHVESHEPCEAQGASLSIHTEGSFDPTTHVTGEEDLNLLTTVSGHPHPQVPSTQLNVHSTFFRPAARMRPTETLSQWGRFLNEVESGSHSHSDERCSSTPKGGVLSTLEEVRKESQALHLCSGSERF